MTSSIIGQDSAKREFFKFVSINPIRMIINLLPIKNNDDIKQFIEDELLFNCEAIQENEPILFSNPRPLSPTPETRFMKGLVECIDVDGDLVIFLEMEYVYTHICAR